MPWVTSSHLEDIEKTLDQLDRKYHQLSTEQIALRSELGTTKQELSAAKLRILRLEQNQQGAESVRQSLEGIHDELREHTKYIKRIAGPVRPFQAKLGKVTAEEDSMLQFSIGVAAPADKKEVKFAEATVTVGDGAPQTQRLPISPDTVGEVVDGVEWLYVPGFTGAQDLTVTGSVVFIDDAGLPSETPFPLPAGAVLVDSIPPENVTAAALRIDGETADPEPAPEG